MVGLDIPKTQVVVFGDGKQEVGIFGVEFELVDTLTMADIVLDTVHTGRTENLVIIKVVSYMKDLAFIADSYWSGSLYSNVQGFFRFLHVFRHSGFFHGFMHRSRFFFKFFYTVLILLKTYI